jgi:hypothetical protein
MQREHGSHPPSSEPGNRRRATTENRVELGQADGRESENSDNNLM